MTKKLKWTFMIGCPILMIMMLSIPGWRIRVLDAIQILSSVNPQVATDYIRSYGPYAVIASWLLMVLQSILAPIPAFLITFANAAVFGWIGGALLSWASAMTGAMLCFGIARIYGQELVLRIAGKTAFVHVNRFFERHGTYAILTARLLPFMPFDIVSYGAGLTTMRFWPFVIATGIGQLPATLIYSYVGDMLVGGAKMFVFALCILFAITTLSMMLRQIVGSAARQKENS